VLAKKSRVALSISPSLSHSLKLSNGYIIVEAIDYTRVVKRIYTKKKLNRLII